jgi:signal transduction histidine kinase
MSPESRLESSFAPAARKSADALDHDVSTVTRSPVVSALLQACGGLVAVLNAERQVLAVNDALLAALGVRDAKQALGLRPGEAVRCIHRNDHPAGCGCSEFCRSCGAAIAIVAALADHEPHEKECVMTVDRDGDTLDLSFHVRTAPIALEGERFLLIFLRDVTMTRVREELSHVFFHDVANLIQGLQGACESLTSEAAGERSLASSRARSLARRLAKEVTIQRALLDQRLGDLPVTLETVDAGTVLDEVHALYADHPHAFGKVLQVTAPPGRWHVRTDVSLLVRVVGNMVTNALEATARGGTVHLWCQQRDDRVQFCVQNRGTMLPNVARRVFQRHFTTKGGSGRGLGTYAMKLIGERYLGGEVAFESGAAAGTRFWIALPHLEEAARRIVLPLEGQA